MRVNRSMFLGLSALVLALGMLGANGYFWWVAQSREALGPSEPIMAPNSRSPVGDRDEFAELDKPAEWFSPYRVLPREQSQEPAPSEEAWRRYYPHETQAVEIAQADGLIGAEAAPLASPTPEPPEPLLFPNPADPISQPEPPAWLRRIIEQELPQASADERQVWTQELEGFEPEVVQDILRMRKNMAGIPAALPTAPPKGPAHRPKALDPEFPPGDKLVPPPEDNWTLDSDGISDRLGPSLAALEQAREVVLHNLANLQTIGYKRARVVLTPATSQFIPELLPDELADPSVSVLSLGLGVEFASTLWDMRQGPVKITKQTLDVAIEGPGFFPVRWGQETVFTRSGLWTTNERGQLCVAGGTDPKPIEPSLTIPENADAITIAEDGTVTATIVGDAQEAMPLGRIPLARFRNASALKSLGGQMFSATPASGPARLGTPQSPGFGTLRQGALELSNASRDEELEEFQQIHSHWLLLTTLAKESESARFPGPVARSPLGRTRRASAQIPKAAPPSLEPLKKLGEQGRDLIEEYLQSERMETIKRTLGLK